MKRNITIIALFIGIMLSENVMATDNSLTDTLYIDSGVGENVQAVEPVYEHGVLTVSPWRRNWFVVVAGGGTVFLGNPLSCNDLFGRTFANFNASMGKWFTPSIGFRVTYQGWSFRDYNNDRQKYNYYHANLLWNVLGGGYGRNGHMNWSLSPFVGCGLLDNTSLKKKAFALSYGLVAHYYCAQRLIIQVELSNATTFNDFDGYGSGKKFSDNLLSLSIGVGIVLGKTGWPRVENATPHLHQNERLNEQIRVMQEKGEPTTDRNNYSGLNSLKARLAAKDSPDFYEVELFEEETPEEVNDEVLLDTPIYFFFQISSVNFTDDSQWSRLDKIAMICRNREFLVTIVGSADSATGTQDINDVLSKARAEFIADELTKRGVNKENIIINSKGGVSELFPPERNRNTEVVIYTQEEDIEALKAVKNSTNHLQE